LHAGLDKPQQFETSLQASSLPHSLWIVDAGAAMTAMTLSANVENAILRFMPTLRGYAISLCRNRDRADDLVQETLTRAISNIAQFEEGTNLEAWLVTIMRNNFYNEYRRAKWSVPYPSERYVEALPALPDQIGWCIAADLRAGFEMLSSDHRQALLLVGAAGMSYDAAATVAGCPVGTMKSRVNRARSLLAQFMSEKTESPTDMGHAWRSISHHAEHGHQV
jgi:RNA polymerase sigma-70 factor (ECF subfamily)